MNAGQKFVEEVDAWLSGLIAWEDRMDHYESEGYESDEAAELAGAVPKCPAEFEPLFEMDLDRDNTQRMLSLLRGESE